MTKCKLAALALGLAFAAAVLGPSGLAAAEFSPEVTALPFPPDARELEIDPRGEDIEYTSQSPLKALAAFYLKEMASRGWEHDEAAAELDDDSITLTFKHGESEVEVELNQRSKEVKVSLNTDGLKFTGADDPAKLAAAGIPVPRSALYLQKELPLPAGVQGLEYSGGRCMFKSTLTLPQAFEHFTKAVQAKGFRESRKPILTDTRRYTEFKKGAIEVSVNVFTDPVGSRVVLEHKDDVKELAKPPLAAVATLPLKNARIDKTSPPATPATPATATPVDTASNKGSANITYAGKQYTFPHVACYQTKSRAGATMLVFSSQPIPINKMQSLIATKDNFNFGDLYENRGPEYLTVQLGEHLSFTFALQNVYLGNSVDNPVNELKLEAGRVRGTLKMPPRKAFEGEQFAFTVTADAAIITPTTRIRGPADLVEKSTLPLVADSPVPFPAKTDNVSREGSKFRKTYSALVAIPLEEVTAFYRKALVEKGWKPLDPAAAGDATQYRNDTMELTLTLKQQGDKTAIQAVTRDLALAKAEGILPEAGKGRLLLANAHTAGVVYTIGKTDYPLKPGQGAQDLKQALNYSIAPATYTVVIKIPGQAPQTEQVELTAGSAWAIIALPTGGYMPMRLY